MSEQIGGGAGPARPGRGARGSGGAGGAGPARRRAPRMGRVILALFLVTPLLELAIAIQVGRWIGVVPTILLLLFESFLGAWIVRREGVAAWRSLAASVESGKPPTRELADAVLVLIGGTLLLAPGFLTDVVGFVFVIPATRRLVRGPVMRWLGTLLARRVVRLGGGFPGGAAFPPGVGFGAPGFPPGGFGRPPGRTPAGGDVVEGEVVDVEVTDLPKDERR
jgi:UPF0716 protein FxsA